MLPGNHAGDCLQPRIVLVVFRQRRQQRLRVRMARRLEHFGYRTRLDFLPRIHHDDALCGLGHQRQVVRDEDQRHVALALQPRQQCQHLRLHRDVERRGRLVGDQKARVAGDGHRDHHALRHAAGQLVRVCIEPRRRVGNLDLLEETQRARTASRAIVALFVRAVNAQRLHQLERHGKAGIEARQRILEDHRDVLADERPPLTHGHRREVVPGEAHRPGAHATGKVDEPHQRECRHRLAGPGLAHDAHDLARVDREVDVVHGFERRAFRAEFDGQALDV